MTASDSLFSLIKSLAKSELRYFRLFCKDENNSIRLFDAMQKIKGSYDEDAFKEKYKNSEFIKNLPYNKHYLYNLILKSLINYDYEKTVKLKIFSLLQKSELLLKKKLPKESLKMIITAKKLTINYDLYSMLMFILDQEKVIYSLWTLSDDTAENFAMINKEKKMYLKIISNLEEYKELNESVYKFLMTSHLLPKNKLDKTLAVFVNNALLKNHDKAISFRAKITLYDTLILLHSVKSDFENSYIYQKKFLELLETRKFETEAGLLNYLRGYNNFMYLCLQTNRDEEFMATHGKTEKLFRDNYNQSKNNKTLGYTYLQNCNLNLLYYIKTKNFESGEKYISSIKSFLDTEARAVSEDIYINVLVNAVGILFSIFEYTRALHWVNKLLLDKSIHLRNDFLLSVSIMNFIIHFEMEDYELLPALHKNLSKKMAELNTEDKLYTEILSLLKNISTLPGKSEVKIITNDLKRFLNMKTNAEYKSRFERELYFLSTWMEGK